MVSLLWSPNLVTGSNLQFLSIILVCLLADSTCNDVYLRRRHCGIGKKLSSGHANDPIDRILPHFSCHHVFMYILLILCFMIDRYPPSFSWQHVYQHFIKRNFYGNLLYLFCRGVERNHRYIYIFLPYVEGHKYLIGVFQCLLTFSNTS